jgi:hypothetical protein
MAYYVVNSRRKTYYTLSVLSTLSALHFLAAGARFGPSKQSRSTGPVDCGGEAGFFNATVILLPLRGALAPLHPVHPTGPAHPSGPKGPGEDRSAGPAGGKGSIGV